MIARAHEVCTHEDRFVEMLPTLLQVIRHCLRNQPRRDREELAAEALAAAYVMFVRLVQRGKQGLAFPTPLGTYGARQAIDGRQIATSTNVKDLTSRSCQRRKGVSVTSLNRYDERDERWKEIVVESKNAGPAEIASIRIDFADWLRSLKPKQRRIAKLLATGETTSAAARKFRVSHGRVSQVRRELMANWQAFVVDDREAAVAATA